ncbi:MAG: hypothetical protein H6760_03015 [Candidatus Nomurabacteria bacterium]|nr:MAG: hypothetical protein H6760_03015 [Candidatus Nomurabacteria bacterium]
MTKPQTVGGMRTMSWRTMLKSIFIAAFVLVSASWTSTVLAEEANIDLVISPTQAGITAGESMQFSLQATNRDTGASWDATNYASFSTTDPTGTITGGLYQARSAGTWTINADYSGRTISTKVNVTPGPVQHIVIDPNSYPEYVTVTKVKQFSARAYDAWNNQISNPELRWSLSGNIGTLSTEGVFTATQVGEGTITVSSETVSAKVDVVGQTARVVNTNVSTSNANTSNSNVSEENESTSGEVLGENDEMTGDEEMMTDEEANEASCWDIHWWGWLLTMIVYFVLLYGFYYMVRGTDDSWIWIGPVVLTAAALAIFFAFRCDGTAAWFPWLSIIGGLLITLFRPLKFVPKNGDSL